MKTFLHCLTTKGRVDAPINFKILALPRLDLFRTKKMIFTKPKLIFDTNFFITQSVTFSDNKLVHYPIQFFLITKPILFNNLKSSEIKKFSHSHRFDRVHRLPSKVTEHKK